MTNNEFITGYFKITEKSPCKGCSFEWNFGSDCHKRCEKDHSWLKELNNWCNTYKKQKEKSDKNEI